MVILQYNIIIYKQINDLLIISDRFKISIYELLFIDYCQHCQHSLAISCFPFEEVLKWQIIKVLNRLKLSSP